MTFCNLLQPPPHCTVQLPCHTVLLHLHQLGGLGDWGSGGGSELLLYKKQFHTEN